MNKKEIILTAVKNSWPTAIGFKQLVRIALKEYNIDRATAQAVITDSLKQGEISTIDKRLILEKPGYDYLNKQAKNDGLKVIINGTKIPERLSYNKQKKKGLYHFNRRYFFTLFVSCVVFIILIILFYKVKNY